MCDTDRVNANIISYSAHTNFNEALTTELRQ